MNKYKNDPDYGDFKLEERRDAKREAEVNKLSQSKKTFWGQDLIIRDSAHSSDVCVWYKGQFIGFYQSLRSAQSKAEEIYESLFSGVAQ